MHSCNLILPAELSGCVACLCFCVHCHYVCTNHHFDSSDMAPFAGESKPACSHLSNSISERGDVSGLREGQVPSRDGKTFPL